MCICLSVQDAGDLYNADYAQTQELFRKLLLSSSAGALLGVRAHGGKAGGIAGGTAANGLPGLRV